jgi:hypothetical protein
VKKALFALALTGSSLSACADRAADQPDKVAVAEQAVVTACPFLDSADPLFYSGPPVDFAHELMITNVSVVDDPCRTSWTGSCAGGGTQGIWTFGELMTRMAGTGSPQVLAAEWLHQWEIPIVVNGFPVPKRPMIRPLVIDPWLIASGCPSGSPIVGPGACPLNLKRAPFRLLAISNRVDLECANYTGPGDGEARFVFGVLGASGNPLRAAVIFEYKLPPQRASVPYTAVNWENDWHPLSSLPIGSPTYMKILEGILSDITAVGALPGGPNLGTSIGQVRTNEIDFGGAPWKLRETHLQNTGGGTTAELLLASTTAETPDDSVNLTPPLDSYLATNAAALAAFLQPPLPTSMFGGESSAPLGPPSPPFWDHSAPSPLAPIERHHFGFNTCNGCHSVEVNTPFLHVGNRVAGFPSVLSPFLSTSTATAGGGLPSFALTVNDPAPTGAIFQYNEPWRRLCEASRMLQGFGKCWSRANGAH